jgi:hypothetical protein
VLVRICRLGLTARAVGRGDGSAGRDDDIGPLFAVLNLTDERDINALFR